MLGVKPSFATGFAQWPGMSEDPKKWRGLVGAWAPFLGAIGGKLLDFSGHRNHGILQGTAPSWTSGKFGSAVLLPGTDEYINIDTALNDLSATTTGTWSIWVKPVDATIGATQNIITFGDTDAVEYTTLEINYQAKCFAHLKDAGTNIWGLYTDDAVFSDNTWTHVALVQDGVSPVIYINSIAHSTDFLYDADKSYWFSNTTGLDNGRIGCENNNNGGNTLFFNGSLNIPMIWNRDLSASEVRWHYERMKRYAT